MAGDIVITKNGKKYKTIITDIGNEKIAQAALNGEKVDVAIAVITDGGGQYFVPTPDMTALPDEVWRGKIANKKINEKSPNMIDVKIFLDGTVGGFTVRGIGLLDSEGDLIAVCNTPDIAKAIIVDGVAATLTLLMHIVVTNVDVLEFQIDPSVDTISSEELEAAIKAHNEDNAAHGGIGSAVIEDITIPATGWVAAEEPSADYNYVCDVAAASVTSTMIPSGALLPGSFGIAGRAGVLPGCETFDGYIRFFSKRIPSADLQACVHLFGAGEDSGDDSEDDTAGGDGSTEGGGSGEGDSPTVDDAPDGYEVAGDEEVNQTVTGIFGV